MKKIIALLLIFAMCLSFVACNSNEKKDNDDSSDDKKTNGLCAECKALLIGEWFTFEENYSTETYTTDYVLHKISISEDGKLVSDNGEYTVKFGKCGKSHANNLPVYGDDEKWICSIELNFHSENQWMGDSTICFNNDIITYNGEYRSLNQYDVVEITEDNWKNYFSSDFNENFDMKYDFRVSKNTWGEIDSAYFYELYSIKNIEKYGSSSHLDIEFSYEAGNTKYTYNFDEKKVTSAVYESSNYPVYTSTMNLAYYNDYTGEEKVSKMETSLNCVYLNDDLYSGECENWGMHPLEILRMKGWLVMKKDV